MQVNRPIAHHWQLNAHYTLSKTIDELLDWSFDYTPDNQLNARAERSLSSFDQRHRFVASWVFDSPLHIRAGQGFLNNVFSDWEWSNIFDAHSGQPFNLLTGFDTLGDGQTNTHRPIGAGRNIGHGPNFFSWDMRLTRSLPLGKDYLNLQFVAEAFNLFNRTNFQSVNNIVGATPLSAFTLPIEGKRGDPAQPLSFTSAHDPRQFQFGLKLNF